MAGKIVLTFDYELFLGPDSGTARECLIKPVDALVNLFQKHNGRAVFFVDASYLLTLQKYNHSDRGMIEQQIKRLVQAECDIGLHLHPQWLEAYPDGKRWRFRNQEKRNLHLLNRDLVIELFRSSIKTLETIVKRVKPFYKIEIFRAGGWRINPFDIFAGIFKECGICLDSSVLPGVAKGVLPDGYDFTQAPINLSYWSFEDDPVVPKENGCFLELPVTTVKVSGLDLMLNRLVLKFGRYRRFGDGELSPEKNTFMRKLKMFFGGELRPFTVDHTCRRLFFKSLSAASGKDIIIFEAHPKMLTEKGLGFIKYLLQNYKTLSLDDIKSLCGLKT